MTTLTDQQKTNKEILSIFGEDEHITDNQSVLCYCDVPALFLTTSLDLGAICGNGFTTTQRSRNVADAGRCKLKVWLYPSNQIEEVSTFTMDTYKTWEEQKNSSQKCKGQATLSRVSE
ncbi:hypothetical protein ACFE04_020965 [Oxalis oulophora]